MILLSGPASWQGYGSVLVEDKLMLPCKAIPVCKFVAASLVLDGSWKPV
jgi:hypothetical protein